MKLLSYSRKGEVSFGIGKSNGLIDLGERLKNKLPAKTIINFLTLNLLRISSQKLLPNDPVPPVIRTVLLLNI